MRIVKWVVLALLIASVFSAFGYAEAPDRVMGAVVTAQGVVLAKSVHGRASFGVGTKVATVRFFSVRYCRATRWRSAAVTASTVCSTE